MFVSRNNDIITIKSLENPSAVDEFIIAIRDGFFRKGYQSFMLQFKNCRSRYPNVVVPIVGIIDTLHEQGCDFEISGLSPKSVVENMLSPLEITDSNLSNYPVFNCVWKFSSKPLHKLQKKIITELSKEEHFGKDVIETLDYVLGEVMDNVLVHSKNEFGYFMGQIHKSRHYVAFTIFDTGQGIYESFKGSDHRPISEIDAITLALREGVTSGAGKGNGLFGLHSVVKLANGIMNVTSGRASYQYQNGAELYLENKQYLSPNQRSTTIDFQLDYTLKHSLNDALVFNGVKVELVNLRLEEMSNDYDVYTYKIDEESEGTGTRPAARKVFNDIMNILEKKPQKIIIDFFGTNVISSSYADELIARLFVTLGLFQFMELITLKNLDYSKQIIIQKAIYQRVQDVNFTKNIGEDA
ncbi:STAS-like domain-containing protein [Alistipes ihumii]|uniref:STAS-like domain-containing protein n=1 Tax=Alistipes ihumii TaxID=1470347 RepID=UPI0026724801|nr:STAS-like domain-containing protein [Alistipes ihumii]